MKRREVFCSNRGCFTYDYDPSNKIVEIEYLDGVTLTVSKGTKLAIMMDGIFSTVIVTVIDLHAVYAEFDNGIMTSDIEIITSPIYSDDDEYNMFLLRNLEDEHVRIVRENFNDAVY